MYLLQPQVHLTLPGCSTLSKIMGEEGIVKKKCAVVVGKTRMKAGIMVVT